MVGEVSSIREATSNMAVASGVEGMVYIVIITAPANTSRNVVYGRDFFEHDKLYTKVFRDYWSFWRFSQISRRAFGKVLNDRNLTEPGETKHLGKYASFLGEAYEALLVNAIRNQREGGGGRRR